MPTWRAAARAATRLGAAAVLLACPVAAQDGASLVVSPPGRSVKLKVGDRRGFSAVSPVPGTRYAWSLDGGASGEGTHFEYRPTSAHVGRHEVAVTAVAGEVASRHTWTIEVEALGPPKIVRASPSMAVVQVPPDEPLRLELEVEGGALTDQVTVQWTIDGSPAGEGQYLAVRAPAKGARRVRAVATSSHGGAVMREWRLVAAGGAGREPQTASDVRPLRVGGAALPPAEPTATPEAPVELPAASPPAPPKPEPPRVEPARVAAAREAPRIERVRAETRRPEPEARPEREPRREPDPPREPPGRLARAVVPDEPEPLPMAPPPPPSPPPTGVTEDDVRALMFRYEQAWRTRNVAELRRIGHIENEDQARSLTKYFATTRDLEVAVHVKDLKVNGGRGTVRFTRRDRFRDPGGREVAQESPAIEKTVVRTPEGVRFAPRS